MYVLLYIYTGDFRKAVCICGGEDITTSVIDAVYTIFDVDGDGHLSTEEFISIMKSRLKRGLRVCFILWFVYDLHADFKVILFSWVCDAVVETLLAVSTIL